MARYDEWLTEDGLLLIEGWAREGLSDTDIMNNMGIVRDTFYKWKKKFPQFDQALKRGHAPVDYRVENALLKRALGYDYEEVITEITTVNDKQQKHVKKFKKHMPADVGAICFWLKNRKPDKWKNKPVYEGTAEDDVLNSLLRRLDDESKQNVEQETE